MDTPSSSQLTTDKTVSIVLLALGALGTLIWALPSIMLVMISDSGTHGVAWLFTLFLIVAWFGPAAATVIALVLCIRRIKAKQLGTWWRVLVVLLSAPVAIVILGAILSAVIASN
jgi:hypothetical protein